MKSARMWIAVPLTRCHSWRERVQKEVRGQEDEKKEEAGDEGDMGEEAVTTMKPRHRG